jgi:hypothetical protein
MDSLRYSFILVVLLASCSMRSFVMLATPVHGELTNNIMTIDHDEEMTVWQLKHEIVDSKQSPVRQPLSTYNAAIEMCSL